MKVLLNILDFSEYEKKIQKANCQKKEQNQKNWKFKICIFEKENNFHMNKIACCQIDLKARITSKE